MIRAFLDGNRGNLPAACEKQLARYPNAQGHQKQRRRRPRNGRKRTRPGRKAAPPAARASSVVKPRQSAKGEIPPAAHRAHAAEHAGHRPDQQQRADETCVHCGHRLSPPREKESVTHSSPSALSVVICPSCVYLSASGNPDASSIISRMEKRSPHSTRTISAVNEGSAASRTILKIIIGKLRRAAADVSAPFLMQRADNAVLRQVCQRFPEYSASAPPPAQPPSFADQRQIDRRLTYAPNRQTLFKFFAPPSSSSRLIC